MTPQQARREAERCLRCFDAPCTGACPTHIDIPTFISMIRSGDFLGAAEVVKSSNALANTCGRVCPEEIYCQAVCTRGKEDAPILIRELHLAATREEARRGPARLRPFPQLLKRVAVVGAGPAGLGCAFELAKHGYSVTVYDGRSPGGVPRHSIPGLRLGAEDLEEDLRFISRHAEFRRERITPGKLRELRKSHDAVFIGIGLGRDRALEIPGERLPGVWPVLEFLESAKSGGKKIRIGKRVVVIGGGNVSLDAGATAKRLGAADVALIYRRGEKEMKVWKSELEEARRLGVSIRCLTSPVELVGNGRVRGVRCRRTRLSRERDASGRPFPVEVPGSEFVLGADTVVVAVGQVVRPGLSAEFKLTRSGFIAVDRNHRTSLPGVFAGGDAVSGEGTIVQSVAHGKEAAGAIHKFLSAPSGRSRRGAR